MRRVLLLCLGTAGSAAFAQDLAKIEVDRTAVAAGAEVAVRLSVEQRLNSTSTYCGALVVYGDGATEKVRFKSPVWTGQHAYAKGGTYTISVVGETVTAGLLTAFPCGRKLTSSPILVAEAGGPKTPVAQGATPPPPNANTPVALYPPPISVPVAAPPGQIASPPRQPPRPAHDWAPR